MLAKLLAAISKIGSKIGPKASPMPIKDLLKNMRQVPVVAKGSNLVRGKGATALQKTIKEGYTIPEMKIMMRKDPALRSRMRNLDDLPELIDAPPMTNPATARFIPDRLGPGTIEFGLPKTQNPLIMKHERVHALTEALGRGEKIKNAPLLSRMSAKLHPSMERVSPTRATLANILDETAAHASAGKSPIGKILKGIEFNIDPWKHASYHSQFSEGSPLATWLWHGAGAMPWVAGLGAIGTGLANTFMNGEDAIIESMPPRIRREMIEQKRIREGL